MAENVLNVEGLTKTFGDRTVVNNVSFDVKPGDIFGFLGPNGSGKTTTIRMSLGIIGADSGSVSILGSPPVKDVLKGVGYLPEQTGLPRKARVLDAIRYLGRLKGMSFKEAETHADELLEQAGLSEHRMKKVESLSRGMTQMIQFIVAIAHKPHFIILDEPFSGLDPLNVKLMKSMLMERQQAGASIMFSTHIMSDVEELCERIALIADGKLLLCGNLAEIKRKRGVRSVQVDAASVPNDLKGDHVRKLAGNTVEYDIGNGLTAEQIYQSYAASGVQVDRFERMMPSLNDIFIEEVSDARKAS